MAGLLAATEREFLRLDLEISALGELVHPYTDARPTDLAELRALLLDGTLAREVRDRVWRQVIREARDNEEWMVAALGLAMPALRSCAKQLCEGLDRHQADEVRAELVAGFVAAVRQVNESWYRLPWMLRCRALRAGLRARKALQGEQAVKPHRDDGPPCSGSPDEVLERAVARGLLRREEADLIGRTRLEGASLVSVAREQGLTYWRLAKIRSRAEQRLARGLTRPPAEGVLTAA